MGVEKLNLSKRQEKILEYIEQNDGLSISEIFSFIKRDLKKISQITISRDLSFLTKESFIITKGAGRAVKYYISPHYELIKEIDVDSYFSVLQDNRVIKKFFDFEIFNLLQKDIFSVKEKEKLNFLHKEFQNNFKKIESKKTIIEKEFERILIEFSWKSSQIEGNTYSLLDTEELIRENKRAKDKTEKEAQMILNHKEAFSFVMKNRKVFKTLSLAKIEYLHQLLTDKLGISRNLRPSPIRITGTNYKPLDNIFQIEEAMEKMIKLINQKKDFFEKSFFALILLSYIQAFEDGNKRTARLVSNAILFAYNSIPVSYRAVDEVEYKKAALLFYEKNNLSYFKQIFLEQYEFAVKNYFC